MHVQSDQMGSLTSLVDSSSMLKVPAIHVSPRCPVSIKNASEADLVGQAKAGDEDAFAEIIDRHQNMVFRVIYRFVRRRIDSEDIAQQVFVKVFYSLRKFDMRSSLSTWIYRIALNESYDYLRKLKSRKLVYEGDMVEQEGSFLDTTVRSADATESVAEQSENRDYLLKLLSAVSAEDRLLLVKKEVEGLTIEELSELTGLNDNTIKVRLFRARKKMVALAEKLKQDSGHRAL